MPQPQSNYDSINRDSNSSSPSNGAVPSILELAKSKIDVSTLSIKQLKKILLLERVSVLDIDDKNGDYHII